MSVAVSMLTNQTAIVLGTDAIGAGIATRFRREGGRVSVLGEDPASEHAVRLTDATAVAAAVSRAAKRMQGLNVLVINVLPPPRVAPLQSQDDDAFETVFARVRAAAAAMRSALAPMRVAGGGRIIVIGHRYGLTVNDGIAAYNAAAWALMGLARTAAVDWGQYQIASNVLVPFADTPELRDGRAQKPKLIDTLIGQIPLRRAGDPVEDIGGAAAFLASDAGAFINGEIVYADGGQHTAGPVLIPALLRT